MPNLDRFPPAVSPTRGIHDYCTSCGQPVLGQNTKCVDCFERDAEQEWIDAVSNMNFDQIMDSLLSVFEGNERDIRPDGGMLELTFFGNEKEVEKGRRLMVAYGAVKILTAEDRLHIYLTSYKDELAIY